MKYVILLISLMFANVAIPAAFAQNNNSLMNKATHSGKYFDEKIEAKAVDSDASPIYNLIKVDNQFQAETGYRLYTIPNYKGTYTDNIGGAYYNARPVVYEPYSKTLFTVGTFRQTLANGDSARFDGYISYSQDNGATWKSNRFYDTLQFYGDGYSETIAQYRYFSMLAANGSKSKELDSVTVAVQAFKYEWPPDVLTAGIATTYFAFTNGKRIIEDVRPNRVHILGPDENNTSDYRFSAQTLGLGANIDGKAYGIFYGVGHIQTDANPYPYNTAYTYLRADLDDVDTKDAYSLISVSEILPNSLLKEGNPFNDNTLAAANSENTGNGTVTMDYDEEGTVYAAFLNIVAGRYSNADVNTVWRNLRIPLVARASSEGDFAFNPADSLPESVVIEYLEQFGATFDQTNAWGYAHANEAWSNLPFSVIGKDHYSFLLPLRGWQYTNLYGETYYGCQLVEATFREGNWTLRKIVDNMNYMAMIDETQMERLSFPADYSVSSEVVAGSTVPVLNFRFVQDIQLSKTADNEYFVAKWLQNDTNSWYKLPEQTRFYFLGEDGETYYSLLTDSLPKSKLYISYRHKDSANWSRPIEAFNNDSLTARASQMPSIVPDLKNIPIVFLAGPTSTAFPNLPRILTSTNLGGTAQGYVIVTDATFVSVQEGAASDKYSLGNAYPNPATNSIFIKFSLQKPGNTSLTIHNMMGQTVATVLNKYCNASEYNAEFNTSALPAGTYYYTLKSGTVNETKMFTVIK